MTAPAGETLSIAVGSDSVTGRALVPADAAAAFVCAHGAGAGIDHAFMVATAAGLAQRGIATLCFNFVYMEHGSRRPDAPALAQRCVRAAVVAAADRFGDLPLYAGGKSFGGRMTSLAQAAEPLPQVRGLVFIGFPLHPAGKPATLRAEHLCDVRVPKLFVQGTRDKLAEPALMAPVVHDLGSRATLLQVADADHGFHVPRRSGRSDAGVLAAMLDDVASWMRRQGPP